MALSKAFRLSMVLAVLALPLVGFGCGGEGTTVDAGKSTAPPVTKENSEQLTKDINAGAGALGKGGGGTPGVGK